MEMTMTTDAYNLGVELSRDNLDFYLAKALARNLSRPPIVDARDRRWILSLLAREHDEDKAIGVLVELLEPLNDEFRHQLLAEKNRHGQTPHEEAVAHGRSKTAAYLADLLR